MTFSERYGFKSARTVFQTTSMDTQLRTGLWNALAGLINSAIERSSHKSGNFELNPLLGGLSRSLWLDYFKEPIDEMPVGWRDDVHQKLKKYFFACDWNEVYDLLQFIVEVFPDQRDDAYIPALINECNRILTRELAGWRFVDRVIAPLPSEHELAAIEAALAATAASAPLNVVNCQLKQALILLSNRTEPDYRNSMKESISAVEGLCKLIAGTPKVTLGPALDKIKSSGIVSMHPALEGGLRKLYAYTSDSDGIRHAMMQEPTVDSEDAKFLLVTCAGFVSYLIDKAIKAGITF